MNILSKLKIKIEGGYQRVFQYEIITRNAVGIKYC